MPSFDQGEKAVVFLKKLSKAQLPKAKDSKLQLPEEQFEVYGGFRGKFAIKKSRVGNLTEAAFKERVVKVVRGQVLSAEELDVPSSTVTFPYYSYAGYRWSGSSPVVNYRINENCADCTGEGAAVRAAAATWSAAGANFSFSYAGTTTATSYRYDRVNEILWRNLGDVSSIAWTVIWYSGSTILECDMEFNDYYTFSTATTPPSDQFDTQTVALHEFGHYLCLADLYNPADSDKVMYGYGDTGTTKRALHADDIAGIWYIYRASPTPPSSPSSLSATVVSSSRIDLSWQDNSSDETGFKIERKTGSGGTYAQKATVGANVSSYGNTGLTANTAYYYRVRAYNAAGNSGYSNEASATTLSPPPPAPTLESPASGSTVSTLTPRLEWNASSGASDYGVQVASNSAFTTLLVNETGITDLYYDIPPGILNWNTRYYWRVNAHNSAGTSAWSTYRYFNTAVGPPPDAPSDLSATAVSSRQIDLTWQDNSSNETSFKIERKTGAGTYTLVATVGTNVTSYSNISLAASTAYYYRVRAYGPGGYSDYCVEATATTLPPPPPKPMLISPASGSTVPSQIPRLEWNASTGASDYGVQVATTSSFAALLVNETGITDLYYDVPPGTLNWSTRYYWRVNARNASGSASLWSSYRYFKTGVGPPPDAPSDLSAIALSSTQIDLTWRDNSVNESSFKIERKTGAGGAYALVATVGANITSYSNTSLMASTSYYYRVRAYNATGYSDYCTEAEATTLPPPPPRPTLASPSSGALVASQTPRLQWNASTGASDYGIQISTSSSFAVLVVNENGITDLFYDVPPGTLNWNTRYYWWVNARNASGSASLWSSYRYFRTPIGP